MIILETKNSNMILIKKLQKYRHYHQVKLINIYLTGEKILPSDQSRMLEQSKFTYSPLGKALEKQTKKPCRLKKKTI